MFHEGLKGWSCCAKRVIDFDEFLQIPGCTAGSHSDKKLAEPSRKQTETTAIKPVRVDEEGKEVFGVAVKKQVDVKHEPQPIVKEEDLDDPQDAVVADGAVCKRKSCGVKFVDTTRSGQCVFHPGVPVFHEGSKGWTCCSRRVLEFDEFLKLKGCRTGKHRFLEASKVTVAVDAPSSIQKAVECKRDWYQTPDKVVVSIFAKKVDKTKTTVVFESDSLHVDIVFMDGSISMFHTQLFQPIVPSESVFEILSTKLEIVLRKANGLSWVSIEPKENVTSWTTFGTSGSVGTIGGKEAVVAKDAPLHLLPK